MDTAQIILLFVVVVLTLLLVILGSQVFLILRDVRKTLQKANEFLDLAGELVNTISRPFSSLSNLTAGLKTGMSIAKLFQHKKKNGHHFLREDDENGKDK